MDWSPVPVGNIGSASRGAGKMVEGIILLQAIVRKDGSIDSFKVLKGIGYGLDESAVNTIARDWKYEPGTRNGKPVDVRIVIETSFRLY